MKHKHAELIHAWANGAKIQFNAGNEWCDVITPQWQNSGEYRIKPGPKPDVVAGACVYAGSFSLGIDSRGTMNIRCTFDGETGKLKYAKVLEAK